MTMCTKVLRGEPTLGKRILVQKFTSSKKFNTNGRENGTDYVGQKSMKLKLLFFD
jgi:hypothetical protein